MSYGISIYPYVMPKFSQHYMAGNQHIDQSNISTRVGVCFFVVLTADKQKEKTLLEIIWECRRPMGVLQ